MYRLTLLFRVTLCALICVVLGLMGRSLMGRDPIGPRDNPISESANYKVTSVAFAGGGGTPSSSGFAARSAVPDIPGGGLASTNYKANIGFVAGWK